MPADRSLAPTQDHEHAHAPRHNLTANADSVYRWSDPEMWPNAELPISGTDVVIPAGRHVLLDMPSVRVRQLTIAGTLEFSDAQDIALDANAILVQGALVVGSAGARYTHRAVITLNGTAAENARFGAGAKGISVVGGALELHGTSVRSWTKLAQHAPSGATLLTLNEPSAWKAGDQIAVSATSFDPADAELATIAAVEGATLQLTQPLAHDHWGELQEIAGRPLDERAEVGLLTRNIVIRGDTLSEQDGFGAQVMIHPGSSAHVEGVEFYRVGQRGLMGRYPLHWHLAQETEGHYARDNAVWHSYNRCMTIHGTNGVTLEGNVCYDHAGHGFFLEDGVEHSNVLARNLGMRTRVPAPASRLLPSDERPATFWITNPDNDLHDNVAAGSDGFGIWYALPEYPTGLSATRNVHPRQIPLGRFAHNTVHSNMRSGLWVDEGMDAAGTLNIAWYEPSAAPAYFRGLLAWKNRAMGAWFRGRNLHLVDAVLADNMIGATFAALESTLEDAFVVGVSDNRGVNASAWAPVRGFWFYDGPVGVARSLFANFDARAGSDASALGFHPVNPWPISAANWVESVRFVDAERMRFDPVSESYDATKSAVVVDRDGSLGEAAHSVFVSDSPLLRGGCAPRASWNAWSCDVPFTQLLVRTDVEMPSGIAVQRTGLPNTQVRIAPVRYDRTFTTVTVPQGMALDVRTPGLTPQLLRLSATLVNADVPLDVTVARPSGVFEVAQAGRALARVTRDEIDRCVSCWSSDNATGDLRLRLLADSTTSAINVSIGRGASIASARSVGSSLSSAGLAGPRANALLAPFGHEPRAAGYREPAGRASSVLKYGSRAFNAKM